MDQNFLGSLLHVESQMKVFLGVTDVGYNLVSQGFEFTEPVLETVLDLTGTSLGGMDFLMAAKKDLDHFLQKMSILSEGEAIGRSLKRCLAS